jgi:arabinogalactan endo-1,4-beta-galactosidase
MKSLLVVCFCLIFSCTAKDNNPTDETIRAADISSLPLIESEGTIFYHNDQPQDIVTTLKNAGCNYIRIRLWHSPVNQTSSLTEVKTLANRIRQKGMKV